jgi:hypothetical protein
MECGGAATPLWMAHGARLDNQKNRRKASRYQQRLAFLRFFS